MTVFAVVAVAYQVVQTLRHRRRAASRHEGFLRRRTGLLFLAYGFALANGVRMIATNDPQLTFNMFGIVCILLANGAGSSWDLLVQMARLKAAPRTTETRQM